MLWVPLETCPSWKLLRNPLRPVEPTRRAHLASIALMLCALIGGLSTDVPTYILSALVLGVYFAMYSGTLNSIVYDTELEETGAATPLRTSSAAFASSRASRWSSVPCSADGSPA